MLISKANLEKKLELMVSGAASVAPEPFGASDSLSDSFVERFGGAEEKDFAGAAMTIAQNALSVRAKSRGELAAHLKRRGIPSDVAEDCLDRLQRSGLINDLDFARAWSSSRLSSKKISKRVLAQELRKKEVAEDLIQIALDEISSDDEYEAALDLGARKARSLATYAEDVRVRRISSALARKGYNYGIISKVLKEVI